MSEWNELMSKWIEFANELTDSMNWNGSMNDSMNAHSTNDPTE